MVMYRVFLRSRRSILCDGEAARDSAMAKEIPKAVHWEVALVHRCIVCATEGPWDKGWIYYDLWDLIRPYHDVPADCTKVIFCSSLCQSSFTSWRPASWMSVNHEPDRTPDMWRALLTAQQDAKQDGIRRFPAPDHSPVERGKCKWCGGRIVDKRRIYWHAGCAEQYNLHTSLFHQQRFLIKRDGKKCACCGKAGLGEVDHKTPLWKVADLPDKDRREYFGPGNLWLLCPQCHKAKSAREAAERAELRKTRRGDNAVL